MRVLVAYASRHGGTAGIADAIGAALREGWDEPERQVRVLPVADVDDLGGYDAVVLGSAVYLGHWLWPARVFAREHAKGLRRRPLWLFSSGPVGDPAVPTTEAAEPVVLLEQLEARAHRTFAGRLRRADLSLGEWAAIRLAHAVEGDYRDWAEIRAWSLDISDSLPATVPG